MPDVIGKTAIVTGSGSGIGAATARALAAAGANVTVADINLAGAESVVESIRASGGNALALGVDVSDEAQIIAAIAATVEEFGGLHILHNNAADVGRAQMEADALIDEMELETWERTMAVNLRGSMLCTKYAIPHFRAAGEGVIINTSSGGGMRGEPLRTAYGTSKAALVGFTRNVAAQYGRENIRCVGIAPGLILTPAAEANLPQEQLQRILRHQPLPRLGRPEDIGNTVVFLASDAARFITGITILVDGGLHSHSTTYADMVELLPAKSVGGPATAA
jgi:NAD(P)-dependent dehydrogenase (short-subunit alcohol dehydrogenase family)